ncbi:MAG: hypothetical protein GTO42_02420 [Candidatus Latescibacteria bacterium]|nr:hypothetical protein [Candidatus Latescibacterota bacterium]NIO00991.1 hypothetical protein [Candidatus Latescibacterota bacterium]NIO27390.1 hypothetical protein [Candidatus Latescibacterota bacterium]NIO54912.1 hypothetical protein [Candidatus Latescibacterota bacterium]NIT01001.1 hypothetical protein [Candidatus Latescibacterota bacterium]
MQVLNINISSIFKVVARYFLVWMADAVSIGVTALLLPGVYFVRNTEFWFLNAFTVALVFALLNVLIRPLLIVLILPVNYVSLGLPTLALNAGLFYLIAALVDFFVIESFIAALIGILLLTTVNTLLGNVIHLSDDYSLFAAMMDKLSTLTRPKLLDTRDRGLVVVQIDGLSTDTLKRGVHRGKMPFVADMLNRRGYALKKWFCGLPSQTSAIQAGIFYGSKFDIPGFRWYSKEKGREITSSNSSDMFEIDMRLGENDRHLLKDGTCINTLIHGGARRKVLTLSVILEKDLRLRKGEMENFAIFSLHPYLYNRAILLLVWDFLVDRFQSFLDIVKQRTPRIKRNVRFSFLRAVGNSFLRESTTYFLMEDLVRGAPVVYVNYIGYDIVAHHAAPHSFDALSTLSGIDRQIRKISRTIAKRASRKYDLVLLSDHGQSKSVPFSWLFGQTVAEFIEDKLKTRSTQSAGNTAETSYLATLLREMGRVEIASAPTRLVRSRKTLERIHTRVWEEPTGREDRKGIIVCSSGNLAHVYFTESPGKVTIERLMTFFPTFLDLLVSHPGIGFVVTTNEEGEIFVMGKNGMRCLRSGEIEGEDPLPPYGDEKLLTREITLLCEYPHSGDVIINGCLLDDGSVVCFEDQIGTHGGAGGSQTEPFIIYPRRYHDHSIEIRNPEEMHRFLSSILNDKAAGTPTLERSEKP